MVRQDRKRSCWISPINLLIAPLTTANVQRFLRGRISTPDSRPTCIFTAGSPGNTLRRFSAIPEFLQSIRLSFGAYSSAVSARNRIGKDAVLNPQQRKNAFVRRKSDRVLPDHGIFHYHTLDQLEMGGNSLRAFVGSRSRNTFPCLASALRSFDRALDRTQTPGRLIPRYLPILPPNYGTPFTH